MTPKNRVLDFIKHDRTMIVGRNIYNNIPGRSVAMANSLNRLPHSKENIRRLCYELCRLVGINEHQMSALLNIPVQAAPEQSKEKETVSIIAKTRNERLLAFDIENATEAEILEMSESGPLDEEPVFSKGSKGNQERKAFLKKNNIDSISNKNLHMDAAIGIWVFQKNENTLKQLQAELDKEKQEMINTSLQALPTAVKGSIKLRDQFPFLGEKDCPDWAKVLVSDAITTYHHYREQQPLLHSASSKEERAAIFADVKASYIENKEIWAELESYRDQGKPKGEHHIFDLLKEQDAIKALSTAKLTTKLTNLASNISRNKKNPEMHSFYKKLQDFAKEELNRR